MARRASIAAIFIALPLGGCGGWQSALDPQGPQATYLATLFWIFTWVMVAVWLLTMAVLVAALLRNRDPARNPLAANPERERRMTAAIAAAVAVTGLVVLGLTGLSYGGQKRIAARQPGLTLKVTGHQWWWEVRYEHAEPHQIFTTANEIHIPVGEPVTLNLASSDVIHSFWVPNVAGKLDLVPGYDNQMQFTADREGVWRGQCAEFCGHQHAHMGLLVVAESKETFEAWRQAQIRAAEPPAEPERQKGQSVFLSKPCALCHTIRGTPAGGRIGPDLTHLGSRRHLAAATLPLTRGALAAWLIDPQGIKPGAHMPMTPLHPDEIDPLLSYLAGLK
jgi:cytochrome c oxidase subunit 2